MNIYHFHQYIQDCRCSQSVHHFPRGTWCDQDKTRRIQSHYHQAQSRDLSCIFLHNDIVCLRGRGRVRAPEYTHTHICWAENKWRAYTAHIIAPALQSTQGRHICNTLQHTTTHYRTWFAEHTRTSVRTSGASTTSHLAKVKFWRPWRRCFAYLKCRECDLI